MSSRTFHHTAEGCEVSTTPPWPRRVRINVARSHVYADMELSIAEARGLHWALTQVLLDVEADGDE